MKERRCVCGWCPTELPDDMAEWEAHHFFVHGVLGSSVRFYPALSIEQEMEALNGH